MHGEHYSNIDDAPRAIKLGSYTPVAAKEYKCQCCGVPIEAGTKYRKQIYKTDEGKIETYRKCLGVCNV